MVKVRRDSVGFCIESDSSYKRFILLSATNSLRSVTVGGRGGSAHASASATPSPGAPWSGDPVPCGPVGGSYLNPEFPDLDSTLSVDPKQSKSGAVGGPQLRPQLPPGGATWTQGTASAGNQQVSGGNGANGQFPPRGRPSPPDQDPRFVHVSFLLLLDTFWVVSK